MRSVITIPAPVTARRTSPASIVQLVRPLDACFGARVGRVQARAGNWRVEIKAVA